MRDVVYGFEKVIRNIVGIYTPLEGEGIASIDFEWIAGAILCIICVSEFFKAIRFILGGFGKK